MHPVEFDNSNKMHFESAHQTFNQQTVWLTTGNAILPTQFSLIIRPAQQTQCNGRTWPEGHLQRDDLRSFCEMGLGHYMEEVKTLINKVGQPANLYVFRHQGSRVIIDGLLLTTGHRGNHREIKRWCLNNDWRAIDAFSKAIEYVTNPEDQQ